MTHSFVLGLKTEFTKIEARKKLEHEIAKLGGRAIGGQAPINGTVTFGWFVRNRYLPLKEEDWKEETAKIKKYLIQADLVDFFEDYLSKTSTGSSCRFISLSWPKPVPGTVCCRSGLTCATCLRRQSTRASLPRTLAQAEASREPAGDR